MKHRNKVASPRAAFPAASVLLLIAGVCLIGSTSFAGEPSAEPIFQVDTGFHASSIRASALAPSERFVVTGSADKTARLWELPSLRLRRTFRIPIGSGPEGRIHDVAISRDEKWVAVAGWTGWEWDERGSIYFFEISSGNMVARLSGLPQVVRNLAYSPDGRHLAVGLLGGGLIIYRTNGYSEFYTDKHYDARIVSLDFAKDGTLAASSADGKIRIYSNGFKDKRVYSVAGESEPLEVRFSPDGAKFAVGYLNLPRVDVIDTAKLTHLFSPAVPGSAPLRALYAVEWSEDGEKLYAAGERTREGPNTMLVWDDAGRGPVREISTSRARMGRLLPLADGSLFWGAEDPAMALLSTDEVELARLDPSTMDFAGLGDRLLFSPDGHFVSLAGSSVSGAREFSLNAQKRGDYFPEYSALVPSKGQGAPIDIHPGRLSATIGDQPVELEPFEIVRHHAWSHDGNVVVLATEWAVRAFSAQGKPLWHVPLSVVAHAVNVAADGRWVVAALSDGTLRWYAMRDGSPGPAVFLHSNGKDWVTWVPSGHYAASASGDQYVGWLQNRGAAEAASFYRAVQFEREFYDAERVRGWLGSRTLQSAKPLEASRLDAIAPPEVALEVSSVLLPRLEGPMVDVRVRARRMGQAMSSMNVYVNKIPIIPHEQRKTVADETDFIDRTVSIPLQSGHNELRVEVDTARSRGVETVVVENVGGDAAQTRGDLYLVSVGVNELTHLEQDLTYAATDAIRIESVLANQEGMAFRKVHTRLIADGAIEPSREAIEENLAFLQQAGAGDTVILFLAGHGIRDASGNYYFVPKDASDEDLQAINSGATSAPSFVAWSQFVTALQNAAGRRVLIVDTCHAQQITGKLELDWLAKFSASSLFALLASSAADELSAEDKRFGAGLFTEGVVRALGGGGADSDESHDIVVREIHDFASDFVSTLRGEEQEPQYVAPPELGKTLLAMATGPGDATPANAHVGVGGAAERGLGWAKEEVEPVASEEPDFSADQFTKQLGQSSSKPGSGVDLAIGFEDDSFELQTQAKLNLDSVGLALQADRDSEKELFIRARVVRRDTSASGVALPWRKTEVVRSYLIRRWQIDPELLHAKGPQPNVSGETGDETIQFSYW